MTNELEIDDEKPSIRFLPKPLLDNNRYPTQDRDKKSNRKRIVPNHSEERTPPKTNVDILSFAFLPKPVKF